MRALPSDPLQILCPEPALVFMREEECFRPVLSRNCQSNPRHLAFGCCFGARLYRLCLLCQCLELGTLCYMLRSSACSATCPKVRHIRPVMALLAGRAASARRSANTATSLGACPPQPLGGTHAPMHLCFVSVHASSTSARMWPGGSGRAASDKGKQPTSLRGRLMSSVLPRSGRADR
jgi:hypothetical protein